MNVTLIKLGRMKDILHSGTKTFCLSITANKVLEMIVIGWNYGHIP